MYLVPILCYITISQQKPRHPIIFLKVNKITFTINEGTF